MTPRTLVRDLASLLATFLSIGFITYDAAEGHVAWVIFWATVILGRVIEGAAERVTLEIRRTQRRAGVLR
ncbi:MAG: hypothetical protein ACXVXP_00325 [Mycobacteriaceae bacterium]